MPVKKTYQPTDRYGTHKAGKSMLGVVIEYDLRQGIEAEADRNGESLSAVAVRALTEYVLKTPEKRAD